MSSDPHRSLAHGTAARGRRRTRRGLVRLVVVMGVVAVAGALGAGWHPSQGLAALADPVPAQTFPAAPAPSAHSLPGRAQPDPEVMESAWHLSIDALERDPAPDAEATLRTLGALWCVAPSEALADRAFEALVAVGGADWDDGYRGRFLRGVAPGAVRNGRAWRVLPSVAMAQAILESGWGRSGLTTRHNNLFGIKAGASSKAVSVPTAEHVAGAMRPTTQRFRTFDSWEESLAFHARLLATDRRYADARSKWREPHAFLRAIAGTYASHPGYADTLSGLIRRYRLDPLRRSGHRRRCTGPAGGCPGRPRRS